MAYNLQDLQSAVQDDLKDPNFSASRITRYLNAALNQVFGTHMFKFCEKSVTGALTIGVYTFAQQTDWQTTIGGVVYDATATGTRFVLDDATYLDHRKFFELYPTPDVNSRGMPSHWTEYGQQVYLNCPVDKAYTFKQRYYRVPTALVSSSDVPDVPEAFREALELYADYRSEKYRGNHDVAATYQQAFEDVLENMALRFSETTQVGPTVMRSDRTRVDA